MKKISIVLFSVFLALGASAQKKVVVRPVVPAGPRIVYYSRPYWNPYLYGGFGYPWYGRPVYYDRPTRLERKIQDIENEYSDRIRSVRADDDLHGPERRAKIRELRQERGQAIDDLKKNYYKQYEN